MIWQILYCSVQCACVFIVKCDMSSSTSCDEFVCAVTDNPMLNDVYISDEDAVSLSQPSPLPLANNKHTTSSSASAAAQPSVSSRAQNQPVVTNRTNSSQKKNNEPLPPIPQHHYDQAARQIQQSRHSTMPASLYDDLKME